MNAKLGLFPYRNTEPALIPWPLEIRAFILESKSGWDCTEVVEGNGAFVSVTTRSTGWRLLARNASEVGAGLAGVILVGEEQLLLGQISPVICLHAPLWASIRQHKIDKNIDMDRLSHSPRKSCSISREVQLTTVKRTWMYMQGQGNVDGYKLKFVSCKRVSRPEEFQIPAGLNECSYLRSTHHTSLDYQMVSGQAKCCKQ